MLMGTITTDTARDIAKTWFGYTATVTALPGEIDLNFFLETSSGEKLILKIAHAGEQRANLELQNAVINHISGNDQGLQTSRVKKSLDGSEILELDIEGTGKRFVRLLTWIDGRVFAKANPHSPLLLRRLGEMCGTLSFVLHDFDHPAAHRFIKWDPARAEWVKPHLAKFSGERRALLDYFYQLFEEEVVPVFPELRMSVNYNDANDYNVLVSQDPQDPTVPGVIDFGDVVHTHTINELAIAIAYAVMDKPDPLEAACHMVRGYHGAYPLTEAELKVLFPLVAARLLISVVCSELNRLDHPENAYLQISDRPAWDLLAQMKSIHPSFAEASFRHACGLSPSPKAAQFHAWSRDHRAEICCPVAFRQKSWLDLSVGSLELGNYRQLEDARLLDEQLSSMVRRLGTDLVLGKYNEARAVYTAPSFRVVTNDGPAWRTVHIGLDFFADAGKEVVAAYGGTVYSLANNQAEKDYGPTIILEHRVSPELSFYTLYGHLGIDCLSRLKVGQEVRAGEVIAQIGDWSVNGHWTPHLHFQLMLDLLGMEGDFPGVCTHHNAAVWTSICPDPWLFITGEPCPAAPSMPNEKIVAYRKEHLGKNLSISYRQPIKMVRGAGQFLLDDAGRKYLDTVNNVAHVGHEHPRVVAAGQRQMAVLNTNTRYLHENLVRFVDELLSTMPPELNVAFLVNSGSEANELAMRLAKTYTGQQDLIVSEVGYHGNTNACVEISSYKFDGPGGKGRMPHIHVMPIPDVYRGIYRDDDPSAGSKYAAHVQKAIGQMAVAGKKPAAFIFESVISCGGQVELPKDFLREAYAHTRAAGGVCVADEVQTGCGRAGDHFWAFQSQGVVPDIVTIGKPIGNGHPLGVVVTTQALADAFKNGMEYFNTFGGNPVSCAIGLEVLRVIKDEGLQQNAKAVGAYLKAGLAGLMQDFAVIGDVRGPGLFLGIELVNDRVTRDPATQKASYFANRMRDKGILMSTDGPFNNVLKIKPPIVFSHADADFLLETCRSVLKEDMMRVDGL
jgi:4-aminobutyrate aminotransferase-like enzyme/Ser/Thr protein kinase RdoA (MazF antagonist)